MPPNTPLLARGCNRSEFGERLCRRRIILAGSSQKDKNKEGGIFAWIVRTCSPCL